MLSRSMKDLLTMLKQHGINDERLLEAMSKYPESYLLMKRSPIRLMKIRLYLLVMVKLFHSLILLLK